MESTKSAEEKRAVTAETHPSVRKYKGVSKNLSRGKQNISIFQFFFSLSDKVLFLTCFFMLVGNTKFIYELYEDS